MLPRDEMGAAGEEPRGALCGNREQLVVGRFGEGCGNKREENWSGD